ncbi:MAG: HYR domain-containing protein, partial [Chitinophagaceae bacterium]
PASVTVSCASAVPAANIAAVTGVSDNCTGVVTVTHVGDVISNQTCANRYTITRTYRATDVCGNSATCTQIITVNDVTAPTVTCPTNITTTTPIGSCTAVVNFTPTATDNCTGAVTIVSVPASGTAFAIGTTTVNVTATDACGNSSTCSFTVTVIDGQLPVISSHPVNKTVCSGSTATFNVVSTNAVSYQWQAWNGTTWNDIAGATGATLTLNGVTVSMNTNSYRVRVIGLCTTVISNHASLYVNPLPVVTLTTSIPPTLLPGQSLAITAVTNPSGGSYVWYKNGAVISGASSATLAGLTVNDIGTYKVTYTDPNGCVRTSADLVVSGQASGNLYVYPNPNTGLFEVRFFNLPNEMATVSVYDSKGARVYRKALTTTITYTSIGIDISSLPGGNYLVEVVNSTGRRIGAKWIIKHHK